MDNYFRTPVIEEGKRNIILQNRCGNRLTLLFHEEHTDLEFVYKPNAFRRKDYYARNFSDRDNFTSLFRSFQFPDTELKNIVRFDYDPFITKLSTCSPSQAKNSITVVNIADQNVFAIAARTPLLMGIRPKKAFEVSNGLLVERFEDRGESIVSFVVFNGFEEDRYRVLDDGTHILQIFENEVVFVGGEESMTYVDAFIRTFKGMDLTALIDRNESLIAPSLAKGAISFSDPDFQRVLDLNRRIVYSGLDEGGACFGAINRIYHLIWVRDGAMTTSLMARSGNPEFLRIFAPFLLNNPSEIVTEDGRKVREFLQKIGSRWTKGEDDGIFYAVLTLFTHFQTTGDDHLLHGTEFLTVLEAIDRFLEKGWEEDKEIIGSDTRGERSLASSPYFGFDIVNGKIEPPKASKQDGASGKTFNRSYTLYNNVNTYNLLYMAAILLEQRPEMDEGRRGRYLEIARRIQRTIVKSFVDPDGYLYTGFMRYDDGSEEWMPYGEGGDYWEYAWAVSLGPFYPAPGLQLRSARRTKELWPQMVKYGFCPWNTLSRYFHEYNMSTNEYMAMLRDEIDDALVCSEKYPMEGALGEYIGSVNKVNSYRAWRALPFTAGSLFYSVTSLLIQSLPMGIAVRASDCVENVKNYSYRLARIDATRTGKGDVVERVTINGSVLEGTLQIPENRMHPGKNMIDVQCSDSQDEVRLYSSSAELWDCTISGEKVCYVMYSPVPVQMVFDNYDRVSSCVFRSGGNELPFETSEIENTGKVLLTAVTDGEFAVEIHCNDAKGAKK